MRSPRTVLAAAVDVVGATNEATSPVVGPMPDFVGKGKAPPPGCTTLVDGDDRLIVPAKDARLTSVERPVTDFCAHCPGDRFKVDVVGNIPP